MCDSSGFHRCSYCGRQWADRAEFLNDADVELTGYQPHFEDAESGFFYFTHKACGSTWMVPVRAFADLDEGPEFAESLRGAEDCERHCLHWRDLRACGARCRCAWVRRLMQKIRGGP